MMLVAKCVRGAGSGSEVVSECVLMIWSLRSVSTSTLTASAVLWSLLDKT